MTHKVPTTLNDDAFLREEEPNDDFVLTFFCGETRVVVTFFSNMFSAFAQTWTTTTTRGSAVVVCERRRRRVETLPRRNVFSVRSAAKGVKEGEDKDDAVADVFKKIYVPNTGKRIKYGVFQETITEENRVEYADEEKRRLREEAARDLTVIDAAERKRRGEKTSFGYIERERESLFLFVRSVRSFFSDKT